MRAINWRALRLAKGEPMAARALPKVSSPDSTCIGAHEPAFGVPSITSRASACAIRRAHTSGATSCTVRASSPPIE